MAEEPEIPPEDQEAFARNAVRTAYYACYHQALDWAKSRGYVKPRDWTHHNGLWECWYGNEPETTDIRTAGEALMGKRHEADYNVKTTFPYDPKDALEEADEFIELISEDINRVNALPSPRVSWKPSEHPNPKRSPKRRPRKT